MVNVVVRFSAIDYELYTNVLLQPTCSAVYYTSQTWCNFGPLQKEKGSTLALE